jgi:hypothetical protein
MWTRVLCLTAALCLSACGATSRLLGGSAPTPVAWVAARPTLEPPSPALSIPPGTDWCRAADVAVSLGDQLWTSTG